MRVLGIDPGYERMGVAVVERVNGKDRVLFSSCVRTSPKEPHEKRLQKIAEEILGVIKNHRPSVLAIERLFLATNHKTAMRVAEARGVILSEAAQAGLRTFEYTPLQVKVAVTGYGRSDKRQVAKMVRVLTVLTKKKMLDDEYDAIAIALTCLAGESRSIEHRT
ncbi:MAG: crossover junction endodeoxyribonuclease RuvC [Parcubacteria group bacterium Gr01-1014_72]|nr:MAG: crossover junction endodeoxyribonuclease RuvC [Parcubacteria group bacterium Gr01-1014_72]